MHSAEFKLKNNYHIPVFLLAQQMSEWGQEATQYVGIRAMCVVIILVGIDENEGKGPQVFKIDPSGFCMGYKAIAAGAKEQEAINHLEKLYKKKEEGYATTDEAIQVAISTLQTVIGTDFKSSELEVGIAETEKPLFRKISTAEIERHLEVIANE